jgi:hypothetical protein
LPRKYIERTLSDFDVNTEAEKQEEAIERAGTVIGTLGFNNVNSGTTIYYGDEITNKTIGSYPILK